MTDWCNMRAKLIAACLASFACIAWPHPAFTDIQPYSALYSIYRNGKLVGKAEFEIRNEDERWSIISEVSGTHGLARLIHAQDKERTTGRLHAGRFRPDRYERRTRHLGMDEEWLATFDWDKKLVTVVHGDERFEMGFQEAALDPLSLKLALRRRLQESNPDLSFHMVEDDEIDEQNFRVLRGQRLETSLGCLETLGVEKIRQNSKRYTRAWHAPALDYIPVRIEHGKTGGNHLEMRITRLSMNGANVEPAAGCAAMQSAPEPGNTGL